MEYPDPCDTVWLSRSTKRAGLAGLTLWWAFDLWGLAAGGALVGLSAALDLWAQAARRPFARALIPVPACLGLAALGVAVTATWADRPVMAGRGEGPAFVAAAQGQDRPRPIYKGFARHLPGDGQGSQ
ncbi:MAG: hypothetical protein AAFR93_15190 [Pseudomonadota bacterium]